MPHRDTIIERENLEQLSRAELRALWTEELAENPPASLGRDILALGIAYARQERLCGGLPKPVAKELDRLLAYVLGNGNDTRELPTKPLPRAGTILVREWKGTAHYVTVTDEGLRLAAALAAAYVVANYKETQLTDVRPGQSAAISVDMFPGITFNGHVDSISPASGQEFALLPPDNATGNFTKVVQRIPVKIVLDPGSKFAGELRPGMSVYPTIETKPRDLRTASASVRRG